MNFCFLFLKRGKKKVKQQDCIYFVLRERRERERKTIEQAKMEWNGEWNGKWNPPDVCTRVGEFYFEEGICMRS